MHNTWRTPTIIGGKLEGCAHESLLMMLAYDFGSYQTLESATMATDMVLICMV